MSVGPLVLTLSLSLIAPDLHAGQDQNWEAFRALGSIGGRSLTTDGVLLLGAESHLLLHVDLTEPQGVIMETTAVTGLDPGDTLGGLAVQADGTRLTILNRQHLARIATGGELKIIRRLPFQVFSVHGWGNRLLANAVHAESAAAPLGILSANGWTPCRVFRSRPGPSRLAAMVGNLTHCGASRGSSFPCWFLVGEPQVSLSGEDGSWRPALLVARTWSTRSFPGLGDLRVSFRDVFVMAGGEVLTLSDQPGGGTRLDRHAPDGVLLDSRVTATRAKLFLDVRDHRIFLLLVDHRLAILPLP